MNQPNTLIWKQTIPGGCHWSGIIRRGTTLRMTVRVGAAAAVNIDATSANNGAEQTTTVAISSTGTGWQTIEVDLVRVSGAATVAAPGGRRLRRLFPWSAR